MKTNIAIQPVYTHEGARAKHVNVEQQLRRSVMACMLWEDTFYESGEEIAGRISSLVPKVKPQSVQAIATEARNKMKLRHAPLFVAREMARYDSHKPYVRATMNEVIKRADELAEFLSIYWKSGRQPIAKQVRMGLADSFDRFNEYQFAKYNRDGAVKLRDVLFLSHAKPKNKEQETLFKKIVDNTLETPDTWEVALSTAGSEADKKTLWERLLNDGKLGALAMLRNLRNMIQAGVGDGLIREGIKKLKPSRVLPFRFITAARYAPQFEPELEEAMFKCLTEKPALGGKTILLVDVSGSMSGQVSGRSQITRQDAAAGLAMLIRETAEEFAIATFSNELVQVPPRRGFALRDAISQSQPNEATYLGAAVAKASKTPCDRLIVITDEQSHDTVPDPGCKAYMINVASCKNGVGYGAWTHIDGWSEAVVDYIAEYEAGSYG